MARPASSPHSRGKKRAVLIGISYAGVRRGCGQLDGPINDVKCMRQLLCQSFGFPGDCIIMLSGIYKISNYVFVARVIW
jgi:metacaspase-1